MNKFTKLLSVFVIAGAIGTGIAGAAGCKKGNDGEKHTHNYSWVDDKDGKCHEHCDVDGCDTPDKASQAHVDANSDKKCDNCGATISGGSNTPGGETPSTNIKVEISAPKEEIQVGEELQLTAEVTPATATGGVTWSIDEGESDAEATISADGVLVATSTGAVRVIATSKDDTTKKNYIDIVVVAEPLYNKIAKLDTCVVDSADFEDAASLTGVTTPGTRGTYTHGSGSEASIADGVATTNGGGFYVDFGDTKDIIEGTLTVNIVESSGTGFGMIRILNRTFANTDDYTLSGRDNGYYRINRGTTNIAPQNSGFSLTNGVPVEVYFKIDKSAGTALLSYDGIVLYSGAVDETDVVGISVWGKAAGTGNKVEVSNVAIATYDVSDEVYIDAVKKNVEALNTAANALKTDAWTAEGTESALATAKTTVDTALAAADLTREAADTAYETYEAAVLTALKAEYKAQLVAKYPAADYTVEGASPDGNKADYEAAIAAANTAVDGVTKVADFAGVYKTHDAELGKIEKNDYFSKAECTITVSDGSATQTIEGKRVGDTVTKAELDAKVTAPDGKSISGYTVKDMAVELPYTLTDTDTAITFTAVFSDRQNVDFYYGEKIAAAVTYTETTELLEGIIYATTGVGLENNAKTSGGEGTDIAAASAQVRIKLNGKLAKKTGADHEKAIKLVLPQNAKITVHFMSGNNSSRRDLTLFDESGNATTQTANAGVPSEGATDDDAQERLAVYTATAGTWYLGSTINGVNIYRIVIEWQA